jgi:hypothetical protein
MVFLILQMNRLVDGAGDVSFDLGDSIFRPGDARQLADDIEREGPFLLPDAAGGDTDIWLNHVGDDDGSGWWAFVARPPTSPRGCFVDWVADDMTFVDSCEGTVYPATGEGLPQLAVSVGAGGELSVDLGSPAATATAGEGD